MYRHVRWKFSKDSNGDMFSHVSNSMYTSKLFKSKSFGYSTQCAAYTVIPGNSKVELQLVNIRNQTFH